MVVTRQDSRGKIVAQLLLYHSLLTAKWVLWWFTWAWDDVDYPLGKACFHGELSKLQSSQGCDLSRSRPQLPSSDPVLSFRLVSCFSFLVVLFFLLFWHNFRLTAKLQKQYEEFLYIHHPGFSNVNILLHLLYPLFLFIFLWTV